MSDIDQFIGYVSAKLEAMDDTLQQLKADVADLRRAHGFCQRVREEVNSISETIEGIQLDVVEIKKVQTSWTLKEAKLAGILTGLGLTAGGLSAYIMKIVGLLQ